VLELAQRFDPADHVPAVAGPCKGNVTSLSLTVVRTRISFELGCPAAFADVRASARLQFPLQGGQCSIRPAPTWRWADVLVCATAAPVFPKSCPANLTIAAVNGLAVPQWGRCLHSHPSLGLPESGSPWRVSFRA